MKRFLIYTAFLFWTFCVFSQVQQGFVKTIGRPNTPGISIEGVTVRVAGNLNTVISDTQGNFSFPMKNQRFRFSRISKKGFELADKDFLHYDFGYSPHAPITLVMVSKEELQRERDFIEEQSRNKLMLRFQKQNAILEKQLEQNVLTETEYQKRLLDLHEKFDNIDTLVSTLADRYARTDYDNIDSVRILVNRYIENGELEKAQQLIYSKGDIGERTKELEETRNLRLQTQIRENRLQQDLAADLLQLSQIAHSQNKFDSAYIYLEMRYLTDTTQVKYLYDLVETFFPTWAFPQNERKKRENQHETYLLNLYGKIQNPEIAAVLNMDVFMASAAMEYALGDFYKSIGENEKAVFYYRRMQNTFRDGELKFEFIPLLELGNLYINQRNYQEALVVYQEALNSCDVKDIKINIQIKIADVYSLKGDGKGALKRYKYAERKYASICDTISWRIKDLSHFQKFIALKLQEDGQYKEAINFYVKALESAERYYNVTNETRFIDPIIILLEELQELCAFSNKYKQMSHYAGKAMYYARVYMERFPSASSKLLYAETFCQMITANVNLGNTTTVEQDLVECLKKSEFAGNIFKDRYRLLTGRIYCAFAINYFNKGLYKEALNSINKAINLVHTDVTAYRKKIEILNAMGRKEETIEVVDNLLEIETNSLKPKNTPQIYSNWGILFSPFFEKQ